MKKWLILLIANWFLVQSGFAQEITMSLSSNEGDPGQSNIEIELALDNTMDLAGFNTRITYDPNLVLVTAVTPTDRIVNMSNVSFNYGTTPGLVHCLVLDFGGNCVTPGVGPVAILNFEILADAPPDTVANLTLSNSDATDCVDITSIPVINEDGAITILPDFTNIVFSDVTAKVSGSSSALEVELSWRLDDALVVGCQVFRADENDAWQELTSALLVSDGKYHFSDSHIKADRDYVYKIVAVDQAGNALASHKMTVTTSPRQGEFGLKPVSPNPNQGMATIRFSLPAAGAVTLNVYASNGQLVETIVDETLNRGDYMRHWNAQNIAPGLYLMTLSSQFGQQTQKFSLIR